MKSNAPWSVKGIERDARETAKEAAKREGMTVGEWLNQVIYTAGDPEGTTGEIEGLKMRDLVTAIEHLHKRFADADAERAEAIDQLSRKFGSAVERVQRLERVKPAEGTYEDLVARVERVENAAGDRSRIEALKSLEKALAQVAVQFDSAQAQTQERLKETETQIQQLAARIDETSSEDNSGVGYLKSAIDGLSVRIARAERAANEASKLNAVASQSEDPEFIETTGNRLRVLGDEIKRGGDQIKSLEQTIGKLAEKVEAAEERSSQGVQKVAETIAAVRDEFLNDDGRDAEVAKLDEALNEARRETDDRIAQLQRSFEDMIGRLEAFDDEEDNSLDIPDAPVDDSAAVQDEVTIEASTDEDALLEDVDALFDETDEDETLELTTNQAPFADAALTSQDEETHDLEADGEEDPFAFADDIDETLGGLDVDEETPTEEAIDLATTGEGDGEIKETTALEDEFDDFGFDFDDVDESEPAEDADADATALLNEVKSAFSDGSPTNDAPPEAGDELDEMLADLDDMAQETTTSAALAADMPPKATKPLFGFPPASDDEDDAKTDSADENAPAQQSENTSDYLRAARQKAKEAAAKRAEEEQTGKTRRKLTPKQRAILAARAKQKLKAKAEAEAEANAAGTHPTAKPAPEKVLPAPPADSDAGAEPDDAEKTSPLAKITGLFGSLTARFKKSDADTDDASDDAGDVTTAKTPHEAKKRTPAREAPADTETSGDAPEDERQPSLASLRSATSSRPVTLALSVALILAVAALFFLVKDILFKPATNEAAIATTPIETITSADTISANDDLPSVPQAPAIDPRGLYEAAMAALSANESAEASAAALQSLQEAAALGHPPAQLQLGEFYKTGQGVDQDLGQARTWFRRAANGGNVLAMHRIGVMTARGDGGPADSTEAIGWFELAANRGLVDSQYNLGAIYHPNADTPAAYQDAGQAYYWYSIAAQNGDSQAGELAAGLGAELTPAQRSALDESIAAWQAESVDAVANDVTPPAG